jgi:N-acetyl-anhydromuramyl-L-alanine amidase AmpD
MFKNISTNILSLGLFPDTLAYAITERDNDKIEYEKIDLSKVIQVDFPENQYFKEQTDKKQIVLHHTVSGQGVDGDIAWWRSTVDRVGTAIIVGWDGKIYQCFSTKYWAHHLGTHYVNNKELNMASIGIEIDSWGGLIEDNGLWYPAIWDNINKKNLPNKTKKPIQNVQVYDKPYRGFYGFEKYTDAQIETVAKLLIFWNEKYGIPLDYNEDMWDISTKAVKGDTGVWTHTSFRSDKSDCHPQFELIEMLKSLT